MTSTSGMEYVSFDDTSYQKNYDTTPTNNDASPDANVNNQQTNPIGSIYRRIIQRIQKDSTKNRRHDIPINTNKETNKTPPFSSDLFPPQSSRKLFQNISRHIPIISIISHYNLSTLQNDIIAGLTVGLMIIPQSMSYANIAGLPVQCGLYASFVPLYAYSVFGTSRQLGVGPVALLSMILHSRCGTMLESAGIVQINNDDDESRGYDDYQEIYQKLAIQMALLVGALYMSMGFLRLGFLTVFLSHAVVSGFTTGAALIIAMSQLKYILGYNVERSEKIHELLFYVLNGMNGIRWTTFVMGSLCIFVLESLKYLSRSHPSTYGWIKPMGPLFVSFVTISTTWVFDLQNHGIPIVGDIPRGLPNFSISQLTSIAVPGLDLLHVTWTVIGIAIIGFMESIAVAKQLASKNKYHLDSSKELVGLGMANFVGALFQSYPVTGSFSRSAVNDTAGAKTPVSGMITATLVGLVLVSLTEVFEHMPLATLAAIVISGIGNLIDFQEATYIYHIHKFDFFVWCLSFLGTVFLGVQMGLAIAIVVSLSVVLYESAYPPTALLGRLPGTSVYRNVQQYPNAERYDAIMCVKVDASFYFANAQHMREEIYRYEEMVTTRKGAIIEGKETSSDTVKFIVFDLSPVPRIDTSALHILDDMFCNYKDRGIQMCFANPNVSLIETFFRSGFFKKVGSQHFFVTLHDAVSWCLNEMDDLAHSS